MSSALALGMIETKGLVSAIEACDGGECGKVIHKSVLTPQHPSRSVSEYSVPVIRGWYVLRSQCCRKRPATVSGILLHSQNSSEVVRY